MKIAAIDIGSNSIHLVIVNAVYGRHLEILEREKSMVRLGATTLRAHRLSPETIERAIVALRRFKQVAEANRTELIIATATAAVRESDNADLFIERARREVGLDVQLLPGVEEARLIALAVSEVTDFHGRSALVFDIGGGSTEFIVTRGAEPNLLLSARLGTVRLTEKYVTTDPISDQEFEALNAAIRAELMRPAGEVNRIGFDFAIGSSGTTLNLASAIALAEDDPLEDDHSIEPFSRSVTLEQVRRLNRRLCRMTVRERARVPGIEKLRADIIVAGGLLLENVMAEFDANKITTCDWSLREGLVLDYLRKTAGRKREDETWSSLVTRVAVPDERRIQHAIEEGALDVRARSVLSLARRYDYDAAHSHHVARLATRIFDDTYDLHGMGDPERKLLQYAALLHDIGFHIAHNNHHRHGLYLIKNSEMPGFTGSELARLAVIVRYHRGAMPRRPPDGSVIRNHEEFFRLERGDRAPVLRLAAILRVADGLDRSHRQLVRDVHCELAGESVIFHLDSTESCDLEFWSAGRKSRWFQEVLRSKARFTRKRSAQPPGSHPESPAYPALPATARTKSEFVDTKESTS